MYKSYMSQSPKVEHYDDRYINSTLEKCANFCKVISGCYGFAFDSTNNICFPAKYYILDNPEQDFLFIDQYSDSNITCNKISPITDPQEAPSIYERKNNAIYSCSEERGFTPQMYFQNQGKFTKLKEKQNPDYIVDVDNYSVTGYDWPQGRFEVSQLDLLVQERNKQTMEESTITNLNDSSVTNMKEGFTDIGASNNRTLNAGSHKFSDDQSKTYIKEARAANGTLINKDPSSINQNPIQQSEDIGVPVQQMINPADRVYNVTYSESINYPLNVSNIFKIFNEFNDGTFLDKHECVTGIQQQECIDYCFKKKECAGVEWNPVYKNKKNVCCPYRSVDKLIKRKDKYQFGKFYEKVKKIDTDGIYMLYNIE